MPYTLKRLDGDVTMPGGERYPIETIPKEGTHAKLICEFPTGEEIIIPCCQWVGGRWKRTICLDMPDFKIIGWVTMTEFESRMAKMNDEINTAWKASLN